MTLPSAATGTVQFQDGSSNMGAPVLLNAGTASVSTTAFSPGSHTITAIYSGDNSYVGLTTSAAEIVEAFQISSVSPASAQAGSTISIQGQGFEGSGTITFTGGVTAQAKLWADSCIFVVVPPNALSGPITVTNGFSSGTSPSFIVTLLTPYLNSISETTGLVGDTLYLAGSNFGSTPGTVNFGGLQASVSAWSDQLITVTVPSGATSSSVLITASNGRSSNGIPFTVVPAPSIISLTPTSGDAGTTVSIAASNIGSQQPSVVFNGISVPPQSSSTSGSVTTITAVVPLGTTTGPVSVRVGQLKSNSQTFTVVASGATSVGISPSSALMNVGDARQLQLFDNREHSISGATWSVGNSTLGQLSTDNPPILTALAPGTLTVTASYQGLTATSQIVISSAGTIVYSPGQTIWSLPATAAGFTVGYAGPTQDGGILQASPGDGSTPDLFAIEFDTNNNLWARGLSSDGDQYWHTPILVGAPSPSLVVATVPDNNGGLLVAYATNPMVIKHIDGVSGWADWEYHSASSSVGTPVVDESGNIFFVENPTGAPFAPQLVELEPVHGSIIGIWQLPVGGLYYPSGRSGYLATVGPLSAFNGNVYFIDDVYSEFYAPGAQAEEGVVKLMQYSASSGVTEIASFYSQSDTCTNPSGAELWSCTLAGPNSPNALFSEQVRPLAPIPDGSGGVLVGWQGSDTGWTGTHLFAADTNSPSNLAMLPPPAGSYPYGPFVLGDSGSFFTTDQVNVHSINISSMSLNWTTPGDQILAATSGGGVLVSEPSLGGYAYLDQNGNGALTYSSAQFANYMSNGRWLMQSGAGSLTSQAGSGIGYAYSEWPFAGGNPSGNGSSTLMNSEAIPMWGVFAWRGSLPTSCSGSMVQQAPLPANFQSVYLSAKQALLRYITPDPNNAQTLKCQQFFSQIGHTGDFTNLLATIQNQAPFDGNNSLISWYNGGMYIAQQLKDPEKVKKLKGVLECHTFGSSPNQIAESQINPKLDNSGNPVPGDLGTDVYWNTKRRVFKKLLVPTIVVNQSTVIHEALHNLTHLQDDNQDVTPPNSLKDYLNIPAQQRSKQATTDISIYLVNNGCAQQ